MGWLKLRLNLKRLKEIVQQGPADVIIGKKGLTEGVLKEIDRRLKLKGVVKVKALKSAIAVTGLDRKTLAKVVAEKLNAWLLDVRGRTFVLFRLEDYLRAQQKQKAKAYKERAETSRSSRGRVRGKWSQRLKSLQTS